MRNAGKIHLFVSATVCVGVSKSLPDPTVTQNTVMCAGLNRIKHAKSEFCNQKC
ncbi:hypothetical protein EXN66_Car018548 [Channa argus]|uniref:Uncharacterized protein n=1 Tax=Channa argus TaxID=215402 RepID=A0A6G1QJI1_CHAAH|nr:hypothetical protein EXN66_Car018548 [Channa argus]